MQLLFIETIGNDHLINCPDDLICALNLVVSTMSG